MQHAASAITAPDTDQLPVYWQFHEAVTRAQLTEWLPSGRHLLVDVSGPRGPGAELAAKAGHTVVRVIEGSGATPAAPMGSGGNGATPEAPEGPTGNGSPRRGAEGVLGGKVSPQDRGPRGSGGKGFPPGSGGSRGVAPPGQHGRIVSVIADSSQLTCLADGCADGVIADDRALSVHLAAEAMIAEIARVLRPGGRVLACVDSLVLGMAVLADQHHWAHLIDLPHAEVVLVPWPDGTITRCFGPDQAHELFSGAGLRVNWIRSRTVFSESVVTHWLRRDPGGLSKLVRAELAARSDESLGAQLVISASKPRPTAHGGRAAPREQGGSGGIAPPG